MLPRSRDECPARPLESAPARPADPRCGAVPFRSPPPHHPRTASATCRRTPRCPTGAGRASSAQERVRCPAPPARPRGPAESAARELWPVRSWRPIRPAARSRGLSESAAAVERPARSADARRLPAGRQPPSEGVGSASPRERSRQGRGQSSHPIPALPRLPDSQPRPPAATGAVGWTPLPRRVSGDSRTRVRTFWLGPGGPGGPWSGPEAPRYHLSGRDRTRIRRDGFRSRRIASGSAPDPDRRAALPQECDASVPVCLCCRSWASTSRLRARARVVPTAPTASPVWVAISG